MRLTEIVGCRYVSTANFLDSDDLLAADHDGYRTRWKKNDSIEKTIASVQFVRLRESDSVRGRNTEICCLPVFKSTGP